MSDDDNCPSCGESHPRHPLPISEEVISLYESILTSENEEEKRLLLIDLAVQFTMDLTPMSLSTPEVVHSLCAEVTEKRIAYEHSALKLGRLLFEQVSYVVETLNDREQKPEQKPN